MNASILDKIVEKKKIRLNKCKQKIELSDLIEKAEKTRHIPISMSEALRVKNGMGLIAEVKKASPSKGLIRKNFDPLHIAKSYKIAQVQAISILTEEDFFQGSADYLKRIRKEVNLPLLRKDFLFDEYQLYEAKEMGADAVLLIAALLDDKKMSELQLLARKLQMECLIEVHDKEELMKVLYLQEAPEMIGINNRNLHNFEEHLETTEQLLKHIDIDICKISESGIRSQADWKTVYQMGADAVLVGEYIMRQEDIELAISNLRSDEGNQ